MRVRLDFFQDVDASHIGQVEVEQDQKLTAGADIAEPSGPSRYFSASVPFANGTISLLTPGAPDIPLDETGVALVVLDHHDTDRSACSRREAPYWLRDCLGGADAIRD